MAHRVKVLGGKPKGLEFSSQDASGRRREFISYKMSFDFHTYPMIYTCSSPQTINKCLNKKYFKVDQILQHTPPGPSPTAQSEEALTSSSPVNTLGKFKDIQFCSIIEYDCDARDEVFIEICKNLKYHINRTVIQYKIPDMNGQKTRRRSHNLVAGQFSWGQHRVSLANLRSPIEVQRLWGTHAHIGTP